MSIDAQPPRHRVLDELRYLLTALGYFTRVPVPRWVGFEPRYLNEASRWFPLVGVLVGAVAALVFTAGCTCLPGVRRGAAVDGRDAAADRRIP